MPTVVATGMFTLVDITDGGQRNLLNPTTWIVGSSGSQSGFTCEANSAGNLIELGINPYGRAAPLWKIVGLGTNAGDGGWVTSSIPINSAQTYRFITYFKRESTDGITYCGCYGNYDGTKVLTLAGTEESNPYFWYGYPKLAGRWYAAVGYVHGKDSPVAASMGGVYDMITGVKVNSCTDYKWAPGTSKARHRTYLYYSLTPGSIQYLWNPSIEPCDGNEQSIEALLAAKAADYQLTQMASDGVISAPEKTGVLSRWCEIVNDVAPTTIPTAYNGTVADGRFKTLRDKAYAQGIWTPTTASTAAKNFYDAIEGLRAYLFASPAVLLAATWSSPITITKTTWLTLWANATATADALQAAITAASQARTIKYLTSMATSGDFVGQLGIYLGQVYRWSGTAWVNQDATIPSTPAAVHFSFSDIEGSTAIDNSGNRRHGTISGAVAVDGLIGQALAFNGTSDYVSGTYPDSTAFTLAALIKRSGDGPTQDFMYLHRGATSGRFLLRISALVIQAVCVDAASEVKVLTGPASTTEWTYIVATHDGSTMKLYVDGVLAGSLACSISPSYFNLLRIGMNGGSSVYHFQGLIDEALVYPRTLSDSEILGLYLAKTVQKRYAKADYLLEKMADDGVISAQEKTSTLSRWCGIVNDVARTTTIPTAYDGTVADGRFKTLRDKAYAQGIWTPTTTSTAAKNFYDAIEALRAYLFASPAVLLAATWSSPIPITKTTWLALWATAESAADALQTAIGEAVLANFLANIVNDSVVDPTEKITLLRRWAELAAGYDEIITRATNAGLTTSISTPMSVFMTARDSLYSYLFTSPAVLANMAATTTVNAQVLRDLWADYSGKYEGLVTAISNKTKSDIEGGTHAGDLNSDLLKTQKSVSGQTISTPAPQSIWAGSEFYDHYASLTLDSYYLVTGTLGGSSIGEIIRRSDRIQLGYRYQDGDPPNIITYHVVLYDIVKGDSYNQTFSLGAIAAPSISSYANADITTGIWRGSTWISTLIAAGLPQGMDISFSASQSFAGKTLSKMNFTTAQILFTNTDATTTTILETSFYQHSASGLAIPEQGSKRLVVAGGLAPEILQLATAADFIEYKGHHTSSATLASPTLGKIGLASYKSTTSSTTYTLSLPSGGTWSYAFMHANSYATDLNTNLGNSGGGSGVAGGTSIITFDRGNSGQTQGLVIYWKTS